MYYGNRLKMMRLLSPVYVFFFVDIRRFGWRFGARVCYMTTLNAERMLFYSIIVWTFRFRLFLLLLLKSFCWNTRGRSHTETTGVRVVTHWTKVLCVQADLGDFRNLLLFLFILWLILWPTVIRVNVVATRNKKY